jgi:hypothetical protein
MLSLIKTVIYKVYILALMCFTVWYGFFLYPIIFAHGGHDEEGTAVPTLDQEIAAMMEGDARVEEAQFQAALEEQKKTATTNLGYMVVEEQYVQGHFHHVGMTVEPDDTNLCIRCHGGVPHDKAKAIRAFLNMHAFYVACETCHMLPKEGNDQWVFRWYDKSSGDTIGNPPGLTTIDKSMYGNYGAKVSPGRIREDGNFSFLNDAKERAFVEKYLKEKDRLGATQQSKMKKVIHRNVSDEPLLCDGCHTSDKDKLYLPFADLGYPKRRLEDLIGTEVVGMVEKYQEFYMPKVLMPGEGWHEEAKDGDEVQPE